jgi:flagellar basal-body rod protein FlgF
LEVLSNNLANVNTTGYKSDKAAFRLPFDESNTTTNLTPGILSPYAPPMEAGIDVSAGPLVQTGNPLDAAIAGKGFFSIQSPSGSCYTRNGHFTINPDGVLSTSQGWPVMGRSGEIDIAGAKVEIGAQGEIYVDGSVVDTLKIVDFESPADLHKVGDTMFTPAENNPGQELDEGFQIAQGYVESSNVDVIRTMTEMIETMRIFEAYQKVIRSVYDTTAKTVNEVGASA